MRSILIILLLTSFLVGCNQNNKNEQSNIVELPLVKKRGFGNFKAKFANLSWNKLSDNQFWSKVADDTKGIPPYWKEYGIEMYWIDASQFAYQNYKNNRIDSAAFNSLSKSWKIDTLQNKYSRKSVRCYVHLTYGKDESGNIEYIVDSNNNNDFSDDTVRVPEILDWSNPEAIVDEAVPFQFELFINNKIQKQQATLLVVRDDKGQLFLNIPEYSQTNFKETEIQVSFDFHNVTYHDQSLVSISNNNQFSYKNEILNINDIFYKNLGVDFDQMSLKLLELPKDTVVNSTNIGFHAPEMTGYDILTGKEISLKDYRDKFVFVEFWGSWCKPCIQEIPKLKKVQKQLDAEKIVFLGVMAKDNKNSAASTLKKYDINWDQILSDDTNPLEINYNVPEYPYSFLIDPKGKIIAKGLRANDLEKRFLK